MTAPGIDLDDEPYSIVYDCGKIDYVLECCATKTTAKANRKMLQKLCDRKLKVVKSDEVRDYTPVHKMDKIIIGIRKR